MYACIILVIAIAVGFWFFYSRKTQSKHDNPLDSLKERFAKGEITKEEYLEQKQMINSKNLKQ
tara:strand:- start:816 stop:1004 length:189 start_codon:yes stop_codon:yes gene_type:complete